MPLSVTLKSAERRISGAWGPFAGEIVKWDELVRGGSGFMVWAPLLGVFVRDD